GFFDVDGKQVIEIPLRYDGLGIAATYFNGGYALVSMTDDRWRIIDRTGKNVKEISCLYADNFCDGLSRIAVSGDGSHKYRFVRTDGTFLTSLEFDEASSFCNGYARIVVNGIDGLLDTDGNIYLSNELLQGKKIRHTESEFYENK
ncbi:MAG: WG repeat-containing protein, partial [Spirochaetia bacterium]|nr:WG repeat-containing protein [Spirochaetia bacterium]